MGGSPGTDHRRLNRQMAYRLLVRPEAEADINIAYLWYEEQVPGLGSEFLRCVDACFATIHRNSALYPTVHKQIRRALLRRFPYCAFYVVRDDIIHVLACLHAKRNPSTYQTRKG